MDQFYMIVLGAIGVLLIIMLTAVGLLMYSAKAKPDAPLRSPCPDYWQFDGSGCKIDATSTGINVGSFTSVANVTGNSDYDATKSSRADGNVLYKLAGATPADDKYYLNPTSAKWAQKYKGMTEVCAKGKWATDLGIVWDGYTNTTEC